MCHKNTKFNGPDFIIIGAAKAATTTLSNMLAVHPCVCMVSGKEPHFFSTDRYYNPGWNWYQQLYADCEQGSILGDASTSYSRIRYCPKTISRLKLHVPDVKIIYMVRHPIERMVSAYIERLATQGLNEAFPSVNEAVKSQPMIVDSSRYYEVFDAYRQNFSEKNIKIIWFEEFVADIEAGFKDVCNFLGCDEIFTDEMRSVNQNSRSDATKRIKNLGRNIVKKQSKWDKKTLNWVISQIKDDNLKFLSYFNKQKNYWGDIY